jgi:hypothetical protein
MSDQPLSPDDLRTFSVKPGERGRPVVTLEGHDITGALSGLQVDMTGMNESYPQVLLHVSPQAASHPEIKILARVVVADEPDIGTAVTRFLTEIDPEALEQAALTRHDLPPGPHGVTKSMITQLIEWSNGRS